MNLNRVITGSSQSMGWVGQPRAALSEKLAFRSVAADGQAGRSCRSSTPEHQDCVA
jgi:hypothetical protein